MYISLVFMLVAGFFLGLFVGLSNKGIHIHNHSSDNEVPKEYNESMVGHLDPDVQRYYEQNNGLNKF